MGENLGYERELASQGNERQKVYEAFVTGEIDRKVYTNAKAGITAQINRLKGLISSLKQSEQDDSARMKTAEQAKAVLSGTLSQQEIVDTLIEKIHIFPNDHIEIKWKLCGFASA